MVILTNNIIFNKFSVHFGEPTTEQKKAYTNVLRGIIRLSSLVFPDTLKPSEVDALTRFILLLFITFNSAQLLIIRF